MKLTGGKHITGGAFQNLEELRDLIDHLIASAEGHHPSTIYTGQKSVLLVEHDLSDGSTVLNAYILNHHDMFYPGLGAPK